MPERILFENLRIDDSNHPEAYNGLAIFQDFNPDMVYESYREKFPYIKTKEVILKQVTTGSGKPLKMSDNPFMVKEVKLRSN